MKLICMGEEYPCVWAEKDEAAGTVTAYGEAGNVVVRAVKVSDFSDYIIKDGHWYTMPLNEIKTDKEAELSAACKAASRPGWMWRHLRARSTSRFRRRIRST